MAEIAITTGFVALIFASLLLIDARHIGTAVDRAADVGVVLEGQVGWMFGVYVPLLLGFYAVVIGGQIVGAKSESGTRRALGLVAEGVTVCANLALLFIIVACIRSPSSSGMLIAVVPVGAILWFLAAQLGSFVVLDPPERIAAVRDLQNWCRQKLERLPEGGRRAGWLVWVAWSTALSLACYGVWTALFGSPVALWPIATWCLALFALILGANFVALYGFFTATGVADGVASILLMGVIYGATAVGVKAAYSTSPNPAVHAALWPVAAAVAVTAVVSSWPVRWSPQFVRDWTVVGAAARAARAHIERRSRKAAGELELLKHVRSGPSRNHNGSAIRRRASRRHY